MCDQVLSASNGSPEICGDYCPPQWSACSRPVEFPSCNQRDACAGRCDCGDYSGCCYQQPARTQPIRPKSCLAMQSNAPMETDTIYKRSYLANCGVFQRVKPIRPSNNISSVKEPLEKCTIQKLSYAPLGSVAPANPIRPKENGLHFRGPLYAVTSQKHDFVPKGFCKRAPIKPRSGILKVCDPMEKCTVNKLSYMPVDICKHPPPKPIVQSYNYVRPTGPGEQCTIQKLSYLPLCIPPKEPMPWAEKVRCEPPKYNNLCTTYNLSYIPNCNACRLTPILPVSGLKFLGSNSSDDNTVYKLSYIGNDGRCCRPSPILPMNALEIPKEPMEKCTVQKLSYQPNSCTIRSAPIRPRENYIKPTGPMYFATTQKHDYVAKPRCRRSPIKPPLSICRATGGFEKCTVNKLSYMPVNVCEHRRPEPVIPRPGVCRPDGPTEKCTTYTLSYLPNCMPAKEPMPWANASSYVKPTAPIEKCTIQKLSYGPPGTFSRCGGCENPKNDLSYPKAGICN